MAYVPKIAQSNFNAEIEIETLKKQLLEINEEHQKMVDKLENKISVLDHLNYKKNSELASAQQTMKKYLYIQLFVDILIVGYIILGI